MSIDMATDKKQLDNERLATQAQALQCDLHEAVCKAEKALRSRYEYNFGEPEDRRFALLCLALQKGAPGNYNGSPTVDGAVRFLNALSERFG